MAEILLISSDLQARARLETGADGAGLTLSSRSPRSGPPEAAPDAAIVVFDLDELGSGLEEWVGWARSDGADRRLMGFFSHVQEATGARGRELGVEVYRRGRFWRELGAILNEPPD